MTNCMYCGAQIADGLTHCPYCNAALPIEANAVQAQSDASATQQPYQQPYQQPGQQPMYQQPQPMYGTPATPAVNDSGSVGWGVLGFFFPIVGLILFLVWKNTKPKSAKVAGIGAIIGFVLGLISNLMLYAH